MARRLVNPRVLWQLSVHVAPEGEEIVADLLGRLTDRSVSICQSVEPRRSTATVYFESRADLAPSTRAALRLGLRHLAACGLGIGPGHISFRPIRRQDWAESWKKHFRPFAVGRRLLVKPGWSHRPAAPGQAVVILDPGLSFGTGQHPTTRFCLEQIVAARNPGTSQSLLDIGTGSGILAIAAVKLGYCPVHGFDLDPDAVRIASKNASRNRVQGHFKPRERDLVNTPVGSERAYDVVCANLATDLLLGSKDRILVHVRPSGRLIISGVLASEFPGVRANYVRSGLRLTANIEEDGWRSGCFVRPV